MTLEDFRSRFGKLVTEVIGTAMLVTTIQLAQPPLAPVMIGLVLVALVFAGGPISGAHYNPSVSLAFFLRGTIPLSSLLFYWMFQVIGAFGGALLGLLIGSRSTVPALGADYYLLQAFLGELVFTTLLAFICLACTTHTKIENNSYYGLAIGIVVLVGSYTVGPISGGVFNPAVALSLSIVHGISKIAYMIWIMIAQVGGGIAGAILFYIVCPEEFAEINEEARALLTNRH